MNLGIPELIIIAVVICVILLAIVGGSGLMVWFITRKQRQDEPGESNGSSLD